LSQTVAPADSGLPQSDQRQRPRRARELQDPLNHYLYHPLAWQLARLLSKTPLTPNVVSVFGGLLVVLAAIAYTQSGWPYTAALGLALHMGWHVVDGADGDLARITGRASPLGELIDGVCDYTSHIVLYLVLGWLLSATIGVSAYWWMLGAGLSHIIQSNHVEVQRRSYQWWVYGTPWLRNTHAQAGSTTANGFFGAIVSGYLRLASGMTPHALRIDTAVEAAQDNPARLEEIRTAVGAEAPLLLLMCKFLGPNPRAIILGLSMLAAGLSVTTSGLGPLWYFLYQSIVLNVLLVGSVLMHNAAGKRIAERIGV
jgi:hypothetical protein